MYYYKYGEGYLSPGVPKVWRRFVAAILGRLLLVLCSVWTLASVVGACFATLPNILKPREFCRHPDSDPHLHWRARPDAPTELVRQWRFRAPPLLARLGRNDEDSPHFPPAAGGRKSGTGPPQLHYCAYPSVSRIQTYPVSYPIPYPNLPAPPCFCQVAKVQSAFPKSSRFC